MDKDRPLDPESASLAQLSLLETITGLVEAAHEHCASRAAVAEIWRLQALLADTQVLAHAVDIIARRTGP